MFAPVKVLIVDDQAAVRESLQVLFELHGLEPMTAATPDEALDLVASEDVVDPAMLFRSCQIARPQK